MMRWRVRIHVPGSLLIGNPQEVAIMTPYGQEFRGMCRYGEYELPAEAIMGMAAIHSPVMRARCTAALERRGVAHPGQPDLLQISSYSLFRILARHGGRRPPIMDLPPIGSSIHDDCTTARFDCMMDDLRLMDSEPTSRYSTIMEFAHDLLDMHPQHRTPHFFAAMVTSQLEYWNDRSICQLPQAVAYSISLQPEWRRTATRWLLPHRHTWVRDYMRRAPKVKAMVRLVGKQWPDVPSWLYVP